MRVNWASVSVDLQTIGKSRWRTGVRISQTWQQWLLDYDLWVISGGAGRIHLPQGVLKLKHGCVLWMRPGKRYLVEQVPTRPLEMYFVHFLLRRNGQTVFLPDHELPPEYIPDLPSSYTLPLIDRIFSFSEDSVAMRHDQRQVASKLFEGLLMDIDANTAALAPATPVTPADHLAMRFMNLRRQIEADVAHAPSVKEMARAMNYSIPHFSRLFLKYTQIVPSRLIQRLRVAKAQQLLAETELPIKRIAQLLGYSNCQYFCRQFKKIARMTPRQFRVKGGQAHFTLEDSWIQRGRGI